VAAWSALGALVGRRERVGARSGWRTVVSAGLVQLMRVESPSHDRKASTHGKGRRREAGIAPRVRSSATRSSPSSPPSHHRPTSLVERASSPPSQPPAVPAGECAGAPGRHQEAQAGGCVDLSRNSIGPSRRVTESGIYLRRNGAQAHRGCRKGRGKRGNC
jgi:hypothetical protein